MLQTLNLNVDRCSNVGADVSERVEACDVDLSNSGQAQGAWKRRAMSLAYQEVVVLDLNSHILRALQIRKALKRATHKTANQSHAARQGNPRSLW